VAFDEGVGDFFIGGGEDSLEGALGDAHFFGCFGLVEIFDIFQSEAFNFFRGNIDTFTHRIIIRSKTAKWGTIANVVITLWSSHMILLISSSSS
jgi:hypothetical protein